MKSFFILVLILGFLTMTESNLVKSSQTFYGRANNWQNHVPNSKSIFIDVNFSELNLKHPPFVTTFLDCRTDCWTVTGVTSIYKLTKTGFRVFIYKTNSNLTVQNALDKDYVLQYRIESLDP